MVAVSERDQGEQSMVQKQDGRDRLTVFRLSLSLVMATS